MSRRQPGPGPCSLGVRLAAAGLMLASSRATADPDVGASASAPPSAAPSARSPAASPGAPTSVWYRSSEGCPEGAVFIARLAELGRRATLARVGDPIDFVVTVASTSSASSGRLERQTPRGTVAIRELGAPGCDEVAEALALSLELALQPASEPAGPEAVPDAAASGSEPSGIQGARPRPIAGVTLGADATPDSVSREPDTLRLQLGAQASLMSGLAPSWAPGGGLFAELRADGGPALRATLQAALRQHDLGPVELDVAWFATRLEGCPFEYGLGRFSLQPCAGVDVGLLQASSSAATAQTERGLWIAGVGLVRLSFGLSSRLALETQLGLAVPFFRYSMGAETGGVLYRNGPVSMQLGLGARWSP
jgi:hypothetical protein